MQSLWCLIFCIKCLYWLQVFSFAAFVAAAVTVSDLDSPILDNIGLADSISSAAGWIIFVSLMAMLIQGAIIALRFLNFGFVNNNFSIFLFVVSNGGFEENVSGLMVHVRRHLRL